MLDIFLQYFIDYLFGRLKFLQIKVKIRPQCIYIVAIILVSLGKGLLVCLISLFKPAEIFVKITEKDIESGVVRRYGYCVFYTLFRLLGIPLDLCPWL